MKPAKRVISKPAPVTAVPGSNEHFKLETAFETAEYAEDAEIEEVGAERPSPAGDLAARSNLIAFRVFRVFRGLNR